MNANNRKKLTLVSLVAMSIAVSAAVFGVVLSSSSFNLLKATEKTTNSITFCNCTFDGTRSVSTAITPTGGVIKCVITGNDSSISSSYVGAFKNGSVIRFYEEDEVTEYTFEDVNSFAITKSESSVKYSFTHYYVTTAGVAGEFLWGNSASQTRTPNYQTSGLDVSQFYVECTTPDDNVVYITELKINYGCTTKQLCDLSIASAPSVTQYVAGDYFNPNGMVVKAVYSNSLEVATNAYTYSPNRALTVEDTEIVISYKGFTAIQPITVSSEPIATKKLSELLVEQSFVLTGKISSYFYEITLDFNNNLSTARRCLYDDAPAKLADFYTQSFQYSVDDSNNTIAFTGVGEITQTGSSSPALAARLKANGYISVSVVDDEISSMTVTLYNQSGTSQGSVTL